MSWTHRPSAHILKNPNPAQACITPSGRARSSTCRLRYPYASHLRWRTHAIATCETANMAVQQETAIRRRTRDFSCLSVGDPVTDIIANVKQTTLENLGVDVGGCTLLESEEQLAELRYTITSEASETLEVPGGSAANVAACIAALSPEATCHFTGAIGADTTGISYTAHLQGAAVEPHFVTATAHPSAVSVCLVTPDGQRTMRTCLGAASAFEKDHLPAGLMQSMQLLHCEGYTAYKPGVLEAVAEAAHTAGTTFSLDLASFEVVRNCWTSLQAIIESGRVEVLFCNEDEASEIVSQYGCKDEAREQSVEELVELAGALLSQRCKVSVFTLGAKGAIAVSGGRTAKCSASKVTVADSVGAGDAFSGAFLAAYMRGADLQACVDMGCAAGAEAVQCNGARLPAPAVSRLQQQLEVLTGEL